MTRRDKLELLQDLVIDKFIEDLKSNEIGARELAPAIALLRQNSVVDEKPTDESTHSKIAKIINAEK